jgi:hypothetical protein
MVWIGSVWLRIGTSGGLLWTRLWTSGFHKMLGSSRVAAQLAASQEGLSSKSEWVSRLKTTMLEWPPVAYRSYQVSSKQPTLFTNWNGTHTHAHTQHDDLMSLLKMSCLSISPHAFQFYKMSKLLCPYVVWPSHGSDWEEYYPLGVTLYSLVEVDRSLGNILFQSSCTSCFLLLAWYILRLDDDSET